MNSILEFNQVSRSYTKGVPVLKNVTFVVGQGEVVGLLGRNGAGKTTLIQTAIGLIHPQSGSVRVFGLSPIQDPVSVKKRIGYVAEDQVLRGGSTVAQLIRFYRRIFPSWDSALESDLIERFRLDPGSSLSRLSKGQTRQVALLCAICHRPELLLLDEPAGGLDPVARREFLETSIQLVNREGATILFSSHHMTDVERIGGRMVLLDEGEVKLNRDLDAVREEMCVAIVPRKSVPEAIVLERVPGCLRVRPMYEDWHAVIEGTLEEVRQQLTSTVGQNGIRCVRVPLEELFIELVGSSR